MSKTVAQIAQELHANDKKVQLIYAFNGTGKTRLSRALKDLVAPKAEDGEETEPSRSKVLYYNAFTEDLFYWDNDLLEDAEPKLKIQPNKFTDWILAERGQDRNIVAYFQRYTSQSITPNFVPEEITVERDGRRITTQTFPEIRFDFTGGDNVENNVKISKGEESNLIWSVFYALLVEVIELMREPDSSKRDDNEYDSLEYVFIDDPVSSLDENNLIELAIDLAGLIASSRFVNGSGVKFIVTTHNPLFFNVLCKELDGADRYLLTRNRNGSLELARKRGASNKSFSYHHYLKDILESAIAENAVQKFHFNLLRNLYEKTASFLGYDHWTKLLQSVPAERGSYLKKVTNHYSHRDLSSEEIAEPTAQQKEDVTVLLKNLIENYGYWQQDKQNV